MTKPFLTPNWWKSAVIYQIYPRSFMDSNGDGIGDLPGITSKLSYLSDTLGVDAIWLSPFFVSPNKDYGYDVADYYNVGQEYGTLEDFRTLLAQANQRGIRVVLDLVANHTSDEHPWFIESRKSKKNPKRDWYIWRDGKGQNPPNNWQARVDGSSWEYDKKTDQYYLHSFFKGQPDLNWRNPAVRAEIKKIMRFWLDMGVAGFRLDIANYYLKDSLFRDNPEPFWTHLGLRQIYRYHGQKHIHDKNSAELIEVFRELRQVADPYHAVLLGEIDDEGGHIGNTQASALAYGANNDGLHLAFNMDLLKIEPDAQKFKKMIQKWNQMLPLGAQPVYVFSNHDKERQISRRGDNSEMAKLYALWLLTSKATPVLYYGEEIGMKQARLTPEQRKDPLPSHLSVIVRSQVDRDGARTPMQWKNAKGAGFTSGIPWIPFSHDVYHDNVATQSTDPDSMLAFYHQLLSLRKAAPALMAGTHEFVDVSNTQVLGYKRKLDTEIYFVVINFTNKVQTVRLPTPAKCQLSTSKKCPASGRVLELSPLEGMVLRGT